MATHSDNHEQSKVTDTKESLSIIQNLIKKIPIPAVSDNKKFNMFLLSAVASIALIWAGDLYQISSKYEIINYFGVYSILVFPASYLTYLLIPVNRIVDILMVFLHMFSITIYKFVLCELHKKDEVIKNNFVEIQRIWSKADIKALVIEIFTSKEYNLTVKQHTGAIKTIVENSKTMGDARKLTNATIEKILNPEWTEVALSKLWELGTTHLQTIIIVGVLTYTTTKCGNFIYNQISWFLPWNWFWGANNINQAVPEVVQPDIVNRAVELRIEEELARSNTSLRREFVAENDRLRHHMAVSNQQTENNARAMVATIEPKISNINLNIECIHNNNIKTDKAVNELIGRSDNFGDFMKATWENMKLIAIHVDLVLPDMLEEQKQAAAIVEQEQKSQQEIKRND